MVAQSAMSVFHAGIIGNGFREILIKSNLSSSRIKSNTQYLMEALRVCCLTDQKNVQLEAVTNVALLLVQLISPDVMFNGLPWPEEEFCKVSCMDLYRFKTQPIFISVELMLFSVIFHFIVLYFESGWWRSSLNIGLKFEEKEAFIN